MTKDKEREPQDITEEVYGFLKKGGVSFAELEHKFGSGNQHYGMKELGEAWLWFTLNEETASAVHKLYSEKRILFYPTNPLVYLVDGVMPTFPVAEKGIKYKTTHWLPCTIERADMIKGKLKPRHAKIYCDAGWDV